MTDIYVVGFDGTAHASRALDYASARAKKSGAKLHLVYVLEWSPFSFHTPEELAERHGRREEELARAQSVLQPVVDALTAEGVTTTSEVRHGHAGELMCEIAKDKKAAQIVIGRTGESALTQRLLGGLALTLAQASPVPVTIVP
ncbi:MAG TPA: universal stress protein [Kiloniellaceae bacterium]|nr:universal stress protein [Kiloniellaceae bacterium]